MNAMQHAVHAITATALIVTLSSPIVAQDPEFRALHRLSPTGLDRPAAVITADFDGDGYPDLMIANAEQDRLLLNNGHGSFIDATASHLPPNQHSSLALAAGDVDGDGDLDVVVARAKLDTGSAKDSVLINDGTGRFTDESALRLPAADAHSLMLELGDIDGDSDLDLIAATGYQKLDIFRNDGLGVFSMAPASLFTGTLGQTSDLELFDIDGDNDLDLFIGEYGPGTGSLHLNDGTGQFSAFPDSSWDSAAKAAMELAAYVELIDITGDGRVEIVLATGTGGPMVLLDDGSGHFSKQDPSYFYSLPYAQGMVSGDLNGDGDLDLLLFSNSRLSLLLENDGRGYFGDNSSWAQPQTPRHRRATVCADVDLDGDQDLIEATWGTSPRILLNDGSGFFGDLTTPQERETTILRNTTSAGDVDGDGDLDLLAADSEQLGTLLLNDGSGHFTESPFADLQMFQQYPGEASRLVDVDGDQDLDVVMAGSAGWQWVYMNDGLGRMTKSTTHAVPRFVGQVEEIEAGDLNGDGHIDLVAALSGILLNPFKTGCVLGGNGASGFGDFTFTALSGHKAAATACELGDFDKDGDLDIVFATAEPLDRLYLNQGAMVFANASQRLPSAASNWRDLEAGDLDLDGDLDLVVAAGGSAQPGLLLLNDGAGNFSTAAAPGFDSGSWDSDQVELADLDEDGDLDVLFAPGGKDKLTLFTNLGGGNFVAISDERIATIDAKATDLTIFDADGDADPDLMVSRESKSNLLLSNMRRQLTWRGLPGLNRPIGLGIQDQANATWGLAVSFLPGRTASPFGTILIDMAAFSVPVVGVLDATGQAQFSLAVPDNPSLIGITLYWQAGLMNPGRLTNLEITTISRW